MCPSTPQVKNAFQFSCMYTIIHAKTLCCLYVCIFLSCSVLKMLQCPTLGTYFVKYVAYLLWLNSGGTCKSSPVERIIKFNYACIKINKLFNIEKLN